MNSRYFDQIENEIKKNLYQIILNRVIMMPNHKMILNTKFTWLRTYGNLTDRPVINIEEIEVRNVFFPYAIKYKVYLKGHIVDMTYHTVTDQTWDGMLDDFEYSQQKILFNMIPDWNTDQTTSDIKNMISEYMFNHFGINPFTWVEAINNPLSLVTQKFGITDLDLIETIQAIIDKLEIKDLHINDEIIKEYNLDYITNIVEFLRQKTEK